MVSCLHIIFFWSFTLYFREYLQGHVQTEIFNILSIYVFYISYYVHCLLNNLNVNNKYI